MHAPSAGRDIEAKARAQLDERGEQEGQCHIDAADIEAGQRGQDGRLRVRHFDDLSAIHASQLAADVVGLLRERISLLRDGQLGAELVEIL